MTRHQTLRIGLVAMLTLAAAATASAQVGGSYPCTSTPYPSACAPPTRYQAPGWGTRYRETSRQVEEYFKRQFVNIENRYKLYTARVRARLERDTEIMEMHEEFADTIQWNRQRAERFSQQRTPDRPTELAYHRGTGVISWPSLLGEDPRFAEDRARIDALLARRSRPDSGPASRNYAEVDKAADRMQKTLLMMFRQSDIDGTTYVAAKSFLKRLAYEAQIPVETAVADLAADVNMIAQAKP